MKALVQATVGVQTSNVCACDTTDGSKGPAKNHLLIWLDRQRKNRAVYAQADSEVCIDGAIILEPGDRRLLRAVYLAEVTADNELVTLKHDSVDEVVGSRARIEAIIEAAISI